MAKKPGKPELMTPGQVAEFFGVGIKTVWRWGQSGKLRSIKTPGGHHRYLTEDVRRFAPTITEDKPEP